MFQWKLNGTVYYNQRLKNDLPLFLLLIFNLIIHSINLGSAPFWYDEIVSVKASLLDFGHIKHMAEWDNNPPFYYYCVWVWTKLFGITETGVRSLNLLFHLGSVCLLYRFISKNLGSILAITSTLLFSLNDFIFYYTYEARCYTLTVFLAIASAVLFFKLLRNPSKFVIFLFGLVNFLIIYTHYIAGIIFIIQIIFILLFHKNKIKAFLWSVLVTLLFVGLRFSKKQFLLIFGFSSRSDDFWLQKATPDDLKTVLYQLFSNTTLTYVSWSLFVLSVISFIYFHKRYNKDAKNLILYSFGLSFLTVLIVYFIGSFTPLFLGRYLLFTIPFFCVIIPIFSYTNKYLQFASIIMALSFIFSLNFSPAKPTDYKLAVNVVKQLEIRIKPKIIIQTKDVTALFAYYYNKKLFEDYKNLKSNLSALNIFESENHSEFEAIKTEGVEPVILVQTFETESDSKKIFASMASRGYASVTTNAIRGVRLSYFKKI